MRSVSLGVMICGAVFGVAGAWGAPGDFDPSFGDHGRVRAPFQTRAAGWAIAQQADGKVLAAGTLGAQVALIRYLPTGDLDPSFGSGGVVRTVVGPAPPWPRSLLVQGDGKIIVVGSFSVFDNRRIFVARHAAGGALDPSFGSGGIALTELASAPTITNAVLQADGKLVVATTAGGDALVVRYASDGTLDPGYGTGGIATVDFAGLSDTAAALVLDPVGVVLLAAASDPGNTSYTALARLDDSGSLDPTFGNGGTILHDIGAGAPPQAIVRLPDGKLFLSAGGYVGVPGEFTGVFFARLDATGTLDPTFGAAGVLADPSEYVILRLARTADDKLIGIGSTGYAIVVERFELDGSHDPSFGNDGEVETTLTYLDYPNDVVIQSDGNISMAGIEYSPCEPTNCDDFYHLAQRFFVVRLLGGTAPCTSDADCGPCEACGEAGACAFGPRLSCESAEPGGASLTVARDPRSDDFDGYRIRFKWRGVTPLGFDPLASDDVGFCLYFEGERVLRTIAPAGGVCAGNPCWKGRPGAFGYRDRDQSPDGIEQVKLKSAAVRVDASGDNLAKVMHGVVSPGSAEVLAQEDMLVQVHGGNGRCVQAIVSDFKRKFSPNGPGSSSVVGLRGVGQ